eukprot:TRINITY_DN14243_c0_g1_i1.p1 TRINITY_DN14243_c0_g1~~TRINITY_DN14243_c0_g1_i1.p1  ORF type:complete len:109 (+),score=7.96 TRINITY_DN14243_c0_g1_i1:27-329(+)
MVPELQKKEKKGNEKRKTKRRKKKERKTNTAICPEYLIFVFLLQTVGEHPGKSFTRHKYVHILHGQGTSLKKSRIACFRPFPLPQFPIHLQFYSCARHLS